MFAIAWQYLLGRAVATDVSDRLAAEWPPHPDRLFQALVAAWGERGACAEERKALQWLEALPVPQLVVPDAEDGANPKVYVPVNDVAGKRGGYGDNQLAILPGKRKRKERYFPAKLVGDGVCGLLWPDAEPGILREPLSRLAAAVTYLGHSSSLVRAWCADELPAPRYRETRGGERALMQVRVPSVGRLASLVRSFSNGSKGWTRPQTASWRAYTEMDQQVCPVGEFSHRLMVLRRVGGAPLGLAQTLDIGRALRGVLLPHLTNRSLALFSGHAPDGDALKEPHVAYLPLGFVGHPHADGHLLGVALALPRNASFEDEEAAYDALAAAVDPATTSLALRLAGGRETWFSVEDRAAPPLALRPEAWAAPATSWATATPVALERYAPRRHPDPDAHAVETVQRSLERQGLPRAAEVGVGPVSRHKGVPACSAFPGLRMKQGATRKHVHVWLRFAEAISGPLVVGAGRFRGYGLFKALHQETTS